MVRSRPDHVNGAGGARFGSRAHGRHRAVAALALHLHRPVRRHGVPHRAAQAAGLRARVAAVAGGPVGARLEGLQLTQLRAELLLGIHGVLLRRTGL